MAESNTEWNVRLWFSNNESLYNMAREHIRKARTLDIAADNILDELRQAGIEKTPDGVKYSKKAIRKAIANLLGRNPRPCGV